MRLTDDEDGSSLGGSSLSDSYVEAPLENTQVGGGDPPNCRGDSIALGHTYSFSGGGSLDFHRGSSKVFSHK